jgi:hypothetical protein
MDRHQTDSTLPLAASIPLPNMLKLGSDFNLGHSLHLARSYTGRICHSRALHRRKVAQAAGKAAQSNLETAKDAVMSAADAAAKSVADADLGQQASRLTQHLSDRLTEATDDIVTAAFNPTPNSKESPS